MTEKEFIVSIVFLGIILILNLFATYKTIKFFKTDSKRKSLNIILIWTIPIFWSMIILILTSKVKSKKQDGYQYHEAGYGPWTKYGG
jgi:preprotein translocase subunit SecG